MPTTTFNTSGSHSFVVPAGVTSVTVSVTGACSAANNAEPGRVTGTLVVTPGQTLTCMVGGQSNGAAAGGFNGGGNGSTSGSLIGFGGDGASDIRQGGTALANRVCVAGGSGGLSSNTAVSGGNGGNPGTNGVGTSGTGAIANSQGKGATSSAGGAGGTGASAGAAGTSGQGGAAATGGPGGCPGGGGGGKFGGGGGGRATSSTTGGCGGGGSNDTSGLSGTITSTTVSATGAGTISITYTAAPPAAPTLIAPANGGYLDYTLAQEFDWAPDPTQTQTSANFQWRSGTGAFNVITGASSSSLAKYLAAANFWSTFSGIPIEWQVQTVASGGTSPWSSSFFFTPEPHPIAPTITGPGTLVVSPNPISWTSPTYTAWEIAVWSDVGGSPGVLLGTIAQGANLPATGDTEFASGYTAFVNGTSYHFLVRTALYSGVWSDWTDSGAIVAAIGLPPNMPTVVLTPITPAGGIQVAITNPLPDTYPPVYNDIYRTNLNDGSAEIRIATQVAVQGTFLDLFCAGNVLYRYRVVAISAGGVGTSSA